MFLLVDIVKSILNILDLEVPWRRLTSICVALLLIVAYTDRAAFTEGVMSWVHAKQCKYESVIASSFRGPKIPMMIVVRGREGCLLKVVLPSTNRR